MKHVIPLFTLIILTSCGSTKQFVPFTYNQPIQTGKGRIYVIKPSFKGGGVKTSIFCDNILVGNTKNGSYLCWDVTEGTHTIGNTQFARAGATLGAGSAEDIFNINVKEGHSYYLKISPKYLGGMDFEIMSTKDGEQNIKGRKKPTLNYID